MSTSAFFPFTTLFDSHCHLNSEPLRKNAVDLVKQAQAAGVEKVIDVAVDLSSAVDALANAQKFPDVVYPTIGLDPELCVPGSDIYDASFSYEKIDQQIKKMRLMLGMDKYFMIGECGMDLYWLEKNQADKKVLQKSRELQTYLFVKQLELAKEFNLPLTIHQRGCFDELMSVVKPYVGSVMGVMHSFTGTYEQAKEIFAAGFAIGINAIVTYNSAQDLRGVVKKILGNKKLENPTDLYQKGIYLETDAPWLPPHGYKGKYNTPSSIRNIWEFILTV